MEKTFNFVVTPKGLNHDGYFVEQINGNNFKRRFFRSEEISKVFGDRTHMVEVKVKELKKA